MTLFSHRSELTLTLTLLVAATGCTVGPDYVTPVPDAGGGWSAPGPRTEAEPELDRWWTRLGDPTLDRLVTTALASNLDLRQATERIAESRALLDRAAGGRAPVVAADASVTERRQSEVGPLPISRIPGLDRDQTIWEAGFDVAWEADLVGRTRRAVEGAGARVDATLEEARGVALRVAAEVARTYLELGGGQATLAALEDAVAAARRTLELARLRFEQGEAPRAEVSRATAELAVLEARLPAARASLRATALGLGVLLGAPPETELALLETRSEPVALAPFPVGERADLLRRRPDVAAAERRLAAATADIGVVTAELYPRLAIGARGGFQALAAGDLVSSDAVFGSLVPRISWRLFDGGRVRAEIRLSESRARGAALAWEGAVLGALTDAEVALARYRGALDALALEERALEAARDSREIARLRYEAGEAPLLELLDAERATSSAEEGVATAHTRAAVGAVSLYKALGGGWVGESTPSPEPGAQPPALSADVT